MRKVKILLIDDHVMNGDLLNKILLEIRLEFGHDAVKVEQVPNPRGILQTMFLGQYDLILLDPVLGFDGSGKRIDGTAFIPSIKNKDPGVPIWIFANPDLISCQKAVEVGAKGLFKASIDQGDKIREVVRKLL